MRTSELVALDWGDIDLMRGVVRVTRARRSIPMSPRRPKTDAGRREVKLLQPAIEALAAQKRAHTYLKGCEVFPEPAAPWSAGWGRTDPENALDRGRSRRRVSDTATRTRPGTRTRA
jgi:integrase